MKLGVNIDHIATLRNARGGIEPSLVEAAKIILKEDILALTMHLREDRRHIKDKDLYDPETATDLFQIRGICKFNGKNGVVEGDGCLDYNGDKFIDTGLQLFSEKNAKKDFYIYFDIIRMDPADQDDGKQWGSIQPYSKQSFLCGLGE